MQLFPYQIPTYLDMWHIIYTAKLRGNLAHLFADSFSDPILTKFLREKLDLNQTKGKGLAA